MFQDSWTVECKGYLILFVLFAMSYCSGLLQWSRLQGCSLGLERLGLEAFFERLGLVSIPSLQCGNVSVATI